MKLVEELNKLVEDLAGLGVIPVDTFGFVEVEYSLYDLEDKFRQRLSQLGYEDIDVQVLRFDETTGDLLVRFTNPEGEEVDIFFGVVGDNIIASVVSMDDEPIEINLTNFEIPLAEYILGVGIDWDEPLSWLTKSVLGALLNAGRLLGESYIPIRGDRKEKLPLIKKGVSAEVKHNLKRLLNKECKRSGRLRKRSVR